MQTTGKTKLKFTLIYSDILNKNISASHDSYACKYDWQKVIYSWVSCFSYNVYNIVYDDNMMRMMTIKTIIAFYFEI